MAEPKQVIERIKRGATHVARSRICYCRSIERLLYFFSAWPTARYIVADAVHSDAEVQNRWGKCLTSSYGITIKQTPDKNAAAEMALQACTTEEQALKSFVTINIGEPWASDTVANLKAAMKQMLVKDGRLSELPEQ
jgi:hypothetical protein